MANATGFQINQNRERGEDRWNSKLTEDDVREIRKSNVKNSALAAEYCVTEGAIEHIKHRRTWKHVK